MGRPRRRVLVSAVLLVVAVAGPAAEPAEAAPQDVVISELMFNPASDRDADEFVEIANPGATAVDLSGWCFGGVTFCFQPGASIAAGGFLVLSPDPAETLATYRVATAGTYLGGLKNSGETVSLRDAANVVVASVAYLDREPWPVTPDGLGPSLELIDPAAAGNDPVNWAAATAAAGHTAGAANSVRATGLRTPRCEFTIPLSDGPGGAAAWNQVGNAEGFTIYIYILYIYIYIYMYIHTHIHLHT